MSGGGAGAAGGVGGALNSEGERDVAWGGIGHEHWNGEGADAGGAAGEEFFVLSFVGFESCESGAEDHGCGFTDILCGESGIFESFEGGVYGKL
ncbi:MAG: hypothetical protein RL215_1380 [Planctomycetota bacterium]